METYTEIALSSWQKNKLFKADPAATDHFRQCCYPSVCLYLTLFLMAGYTSGCKWWWNRVLSLFPRSRGAACFDGTVCILHGYCSVAATRSSRLSCRQAAWFWMGDESDDTMNSVLHVRANKPRSGKLLLRNEVDKCFPSPDWSFGFPAARMKTVIESRRLNLISDSRALMRKR